MSQVHQQYFLYQHLCFKNNSFIEIIYELVFIEIIY